MAYWASLKTSQPPPTPPATTAPVVDGSISPGVLLAIVIVAAVFFFSGLLHLLVRYLLRPNPRDLDEGPDGFTVLQGRLQHLFHLHDAGVNQSFIDALPVFVYGSVVGPKEATFDCAVCLCEFEADDRLRLLPRCSHAFHLECIDTWLLAHSTCPLCRGSLVPDPAVAVLESGGESSREIAGGRDDSPQHDVEDPGVATNDASQRAGESGQKREALAAAGEAPPPSAMVLPVKLGKCRNAGASAGGDREGSSTRSPIVDERRCFSMGSFEYVMDETSLLQVAIRPPARKPSVKRPGHRPAMSDCAGVKEGFTLFHPATTAAESRVEDGRAIAGIGAHSRQRMESFSFSKVWLRPKKENAEAEDGPRRSFSLRLPLQERRTPALETEASRSQTKGRDELAFEAEGGRPSNRAVSRAEETPSFARRTLLWIAGRQRKVVMSHV